MKKTRETYWYDYNSDNKSMTIYEDNKTLADLSDVTSKEQVNSSKMLYGI